MIFLNKKFSEAIFYSFIKLLSRKLFYLSFLIAKNNVIITIITKT